MGDRARFSRFKPQESRPIPCLRPLSASHPNNVRHSTLKCVQPSLVKDLALYTAQLWCYAEAELVSWECQEAANQTGTLGKDSGTFAAPRLVHPTIWLNRKRNNLRVYA